MSLPRPQSRIIVLLALCIGGALPHAEAQERIGIHVFGASYHYQSKTYFDEFGEEQDLRELNPGLGLVATLRTTNRTVLEVHGGVYRSSINAATFVTGLSWQFKLPLNLRLGPALIIGGDGRGVGGGPVPIVGWSKGRVAVSGVWLISPHPEYSSAFATFATFYFR